MEEKKIGFDNEKYIKMQSQKIHERIDSFGSKLYMEFGGKLFDDFHASRVLPGFKPDSKLKMLLELKDEAEIVISVCASAIEQKKRRGDLGITYDKEVLRLLDSFRSVGLLAKSVVVTQYEKSKSVDEFIDHLRQLGVCVYLHYKIDGYPLNAEKIVSEEGFGKNDFIKTERRLVIVTAPGPGSGKMATCLSQLYHENKRGVTAGYAKFETFPIWNLPLSHPVNLAYEAATADLGDINMIDPFHLEKYGVTTVNYNRDIEIFPVLKALFESIFGSCPYFSPTDMGVNMAGYCIVDDDVCKKASRDEIIRRYFEALKQKAMGKNVQNQIEKLELLMKKAEVTPNDREVFLKTEELKIATNHPVCAVRLNSGKIITGKTKPLLGCVSAVLLNSLKYLAKIDDDVDLIPKQLIEPVMKMKVLYLKTTNPHLHASDILTLLSVSAQSDENAKKALCALPLLKGAECHCSVILSEKDSQVLSKLGLNVTCSPSYESEKLYH